MRVLVIIALSLTITATSRLPRGRHGRYLRMAPSQILLPKPGADEVAAFENSPLRRYSGDFVKSKELKQKHKNHLLFKKPSRQHKKYNKYSDKYDDEYNNYDDKYNNFADKYNKYDNEYNNNYDNKLIDKYNKLFNKDGMIYLTPPELDDDRKLNKLMNNVVTYREDDDGDGYLRRPLEKVFDREEMSRLKKIVEAIKGQDGPTTPKMVYNFAELVI